MRAHQAFQSSLLLLVAALLGAPPARAEPAAPAEPPPFDLAEEIAQGPPMTAERAAQRAAERAPAVERAAALARAAEVAVARTRDQLIPRLELTARFVHVDGFPDGRIELRRDPVALAAAHGLAERIADPASRTLWLSSLEQPVTPRISIPRNQAALTARVSWPVSDLFFAVAPALEAAKASARAADAQHAARVARVRLSARESFYQLARARGALSVARRAEQQARAQEARIEAAVRAGMRAPADLASAKARVAAAVQAITAAEAGVDVVDAALRTLLDDEDGPLYGIAEPLDNASPESELPSVRLLVARARERRSELRALRESIFAQQRSRRASDASGYPRLGLYAGADYARPNRYVIPPNEDFQASWEVGATLSYAPNDTLAAARRARESGAHVTALEAELRELERALMLEVRQARAALLRAERAIGASRAAETAAGEAYAQRLAELRAGAAVTADVFAAESELNRARLDLLDALIEQRVAAARLAYAVGE